jgi:hypothetical protein
VGSSTGRPGDHQEVASAGDATEVAAEGEDVVGEGWAEEEVRRRAGDQFWPVAIEECRVLSPRAIAVGVGSMDSLSCTRSTLSCRLIDPLRLSAVQDSGASDPAQLYVLFFCLFVFSSSAFAAYLVCIRHLLYLLQDLLCSLRDFLDDFSRLARFWRLKEEEGKHGH